MTDAYPKDAQWKEHTITSVDVRRPDDKGWGIGFDGFGFFMPDSPAGEPKVGDTIRQYGGGFGYPVRGLYLNGRKIYYRTKAEDEDHSADELYGTTATDIIERWDAGRSIWSIVMGGLGPGYEQAIQIAAVEMLREWIAMEPDRVAMRGDRWKDIRDDCEARLKGNPVMDRLGLSGAQWGAAMQLSTAWYLDGPRKTLLRVKDDRRIQVSKPFPQG